MTTRQLWAVTRTTLLSLSAVIAFLATWHVAAMVFANAVILPSPGAVASALANQIGSAELVNHAAFSGLRLVIAFAIAAAVGIPLGLSIGASWLLEDVLDPFVELIRPISGIAWIPVGLYLFGISNSLPIFIMFYVAVFPFILNTASGVRSVDRLFIRAAQTMGLSRRAILRQVVLPSSVPSMLTGARLGAGGAWLGLVAAEFIGAPSGLGFSIQWYATLLRTADMLAYVVAVGFFGFLTDWVLRQLQRRLTPWAAGMVVAQ